MNTTYPGYDNAVQGTDGFHYIAVGQKVPLKYDADYKGNKYVCSLTGANHPMDTVKIKTSYDVTGLKYGDVFYLRSRKFVFRTFFCLEGQEPKVAGWPVINGIRQDDCVTVGKVKDIRLQ